MVDVAFQPNGIARTRGARKRSSLRVALKRKSTAAFLMTLPLILLIGILVIYPAFYSVHLATLNKSMQRFVGFGNFEFLFKRETFWLVVKQGLRAPLIGLAIGLVVASLTGRVLLTLLFGVTPRDPLVFASVALLLAVVCLSSCGLPARQACRTNPAQALRNE